MYIHIGNNVLLRKDEVIGVFSIQSLMEDNKGRKFLADVKQNREVEDISGGKHTSLVITDTKAFITRITSATLLARSGNDLLDILKSPGTEPVEINAKEK